MNLRLKEGRGAPTTCQKLKTMLKGSSWFLQKEPSWPGCDLDQC